MFAGERISQLIKDFFDVQHIVKSAPIVIVPNQPPLSVALLSLRGQILHQAVGQLVCVIQRVRNNHREMKSPCFFCFCFFLGSVGDGGCGGEAAANRESFNGCLASCTWPFWFPNEGTMLLNKALCHYRWEHIA